MGILIFVFLLAHTFPTLTFELPNYERAYKIAHILRHPLPFYNFLFTIKIPARPVAKHNKTRTRPGAGHMLA